MQKNGQWATHQTRYEPRRQVFVESCHHRLPLGWNPGAVGQAELEIERLNQVPEVESLVSTYLIKSMVIKWIYLSFPSLCRVCFFFFEPLVHMYMMGKFTKHPQTKILKPVLVYLQEYKYWKHGRRSASGQWSPRGRSLNSSKSVFNLEGVLSNRRSPRTGRLSSSKYSWWIVSARPPGYALSKTQAQLGMIGWWWNTSGFSMLWWRYSV